MVSPEPAAVRTKTICLVRIGDEALTAKGLIKTVTWYADEAALSRNSGEFLALANHPAWVVRRSLAPRFIEVLDGAAVAELFQQFGVFRSLLNR